MSEDSIERQISVTQVLLAISGMAFTATLILAAPGLPDTKPTSGTLSLVPLLCALLFLALELKLVFLLLRQREKMQSGTEKFVVVALFFAINFFAGAVQLLLATVLWPVWIIIMLVILVRAALKLQTDS